MPNITFTFFAIVYEAYKPHRNQCRVRVARPGRASIVMERPNWGHLFKDIESSFPGSVYDIPDEIEVITYNKQFKQKE